MKIKGIVISLITAIIICNIPISTLYANSDNVYSKEYIVKQEEQFVSNDYFGNSNKDFEYKSGNIPLLISAPHAVKQWRNNKYKSADVYTGALAKALHQSTGAYVIYKTKTNGDENYTISETEYRKKIKEIVKENNIKIVIDLHGMSADRDSDIDIGTGNEKNINLLGQNHILSSVENSLNGLDYTVNKYFSGGSSKTISTYCRKKIGVPTLQLEINRKYRDKDSKSFSYITNKLTEMINNLIM